MHITRVLSILYVCSYAVVHVCTVLRGFRFAYFLTSRFGSYSESQMRVVSYPAPFISFCTVNTHWSESRALRADRPKLAFVNLLNRTYIYRQSVCTRVAVALFVLLVAHWASGTRRERIIVTGGAVDFQYFELKVNDGPYIIQEFTQRVNLFFFCNSCSLLTIPFHYLILSCLYVFFASLWRLPLNPYKTTSYQIWNWSSKFEIGKYYAYWKYVPQRIWGHTQCSYYY